MKSNMSTDSTLLTLNHGPFMFSGFCPHHSQINWSQLLMIPKTSCPLPKSRSILERSAICRGPSRARPGTNGKVPSELHPGEPSESSSKTSCSSCWHQQNQNRNMELWLKFNWLQVQYIPTSRFYHSRNLVWNKYLSDQWFKEVNCVINYDLFKFWLVLMVSVEDLSNSMQLCAPDFWMKAVSPFRHLSPSDGGECTRSMHEHCQVAVPPRSTAVCQGNNSEAPIPQNKTQYNKRKHLLFGGHLISTGCWGGIWFQLLFGGASDFNW